MQTNHVPGLVFWFRTDRKIYFPFLLYPDMVYSLLAIDPAFREFGKQDDQRLNK